MATWTMTDVEFDAYVEQTYSDSEFAKFDKFRQKVIDRLAEDMPDWICRGVRQAVNRKETSRLTSLQSYIRKINSVDLLSMFKQAVQALSSKNYIDGRFCQPIVKFAKDGTIELPKGNIPQIIKDIVNARTSVVTTKEQFMEFATAEKAKTEKKVKTDHDLLMESFALFTNRLAKVHGNGKLIPEPFASKLEELAKIL